MKQYFWWIKLISAVKLLMIMQVWKNTYNIVLFSINKFKTPIQDLKVQPSKFYDPYSCFSFIIHHS